MATEFGSINETLSAGLVSNQLTRLLASWQTDWQVKVSLEEFEQISKNKTAKHYPSKHGKEHEKQLQCSCGFCCNLKWTLIFPLRFIECQCLGGKLPSFGGVKGFVEFYCMVGLFVWNWPNSAACVVLFLFCFIFSNNKNYNILPNYQRLAKSTAHLF